MEKGRKQRGEIPEIRPQLAALRYVRVNPVSTPSEGYKGAGAHPRAGSFTAVEGGGNMETTAIRERLTLMAKTGATLRDLVGTLDRYRGLSGNDYDTLWLHCWVLARRQPRPVQAPGVAGDHDEIAYGDIGPG
jgi:hypothetical protein